MTRDPALRPDAEQLPGTAPRVLLLGGGSPRHAGGRAMRWWALRRALNRHAFCDFREITCNRWTRCRTACQLTGEPGGDPTLRSVGEEGVWFYDRNYCAQYARQLADEITAGGYSTVVCSGLETHRYVTALAGHPRTSVVFDMHNVEFALNQAIHEAAPPGTVYADLFTEQHVGFVAAAERAAVAAADALWVCSAEDRALIAALHDDAAAEKTTVVPHAVALGDGARPADGCRRLVYTGRMDYYPNLLAGLTLVYEIAPLLRARGNDVPMVIAGASAEVLDGRRRPSHVELVPDPASVADLITGGIMVVPLSIGGGTRFKILEAFAYGAPVISTAKGAEGIEAVPGTHYLAAEEPAEFAAAVDALTRDPALRSSLVTAAWELVRDRYSVAALAARLREALPVAGRGGGRSGS